MFFFLIYISIKAKLHVQILSAQRVFIFEISSSHGVHMNIISADESVAFSHLQYLLSKCMFSICP